MSNRGLKAGSGPAAKQSSAIPIPVPSLYHIGCRITDLENVHDSYDTQQLDKALSSQQHHALERAKSLVYAQVEALVDLGLAMVPETVPDVVAQLVMAERRLDWMISCDLSGREMKGIADDVLHVVRASLPLLARAAGVPMEDVSNSDGDFSAWERLETVEVR
jgi:hypothetical protein